MQKMRGRGLISAAIITAVVIFDQVTKYFAFGSLKDEGVKKFIPGLLRFHYTENTGASLGLFKDQRWLFMSLSAAAIVFMTYWLFKYGKENVLSAIGMCFILGGGVGNMIDRIFRTFVVDFLEFPFVTFAIFNVADSFISIGTVIFIVFLIKTERKKIKGKKEVPADENTSGGSEPTE